ncbi:AfsR/SARP family transcriptional regulator [Dactylosporangium darangshiense]|uniref:AfsR/SARP family transcriptional regulator n=1 Tax=Dactylosporangium darangshiense TaxID=579108 RepID=UPI003627839B
MQIRTPVTEITVAAPRERVLLALLLLREGQLVPVQQVIAALWDTNPPPTARAQVHSCVSRLRQVLRKAGLPEDLVVTEPAGYRIKVGPEDLDAALFAARVERGRAAAADGDLAGGRDDLRAALALWRGRPLTDVDSDMVRAAAAHLEEQWTAAMALCLDLELQLDLAEEILAEVADLVERFPHHEQFRGHLMTALARTGRRADALAVFRRGRALLAEELGIEPGADLVELHRRILNGDAELLLPQAPRTLGRRAARCLPRDVADFAGRAELVRRLVDALRDERPEIIAIDGMPGTGKTTLAVRVAHAASERYPDGQLYLDLRGHSERAPLDPGEALGALLRQLGVPAERVPPGLDDRAVLWRTELADRQVLVLLDNAFDTAQVLPMLPGTAHTGVVITSRRRLGGLDGAQTVSLDVLPIDDAVELLRRTVGERAYADPACTVEVAELCGRLPLAVRLAGARLQHRPSWTVADLAARLRIANRRLPELAVDGRTVAAAFTLSFQHLAVPLQRLLRFSDCTRRATSNPRRPRRWPDCRCRRPRRCWRTSSTCTWSRLRRPAGTACTTCYATTPPSSRTATPTPSGDCSITICTAWSPRRSSWSSPTPARCCGWTARRRPRWSSTRRPTRAAGSSANCPTSSASRASPPRPAGTGTRAC